MSRFVLNQYQYAGLTGSDVDDQPVFAEAVVTVLPVLLFVIEHAGCVKSEFVSPNKYNFGFV
jgi:hypothetical protein